MRKIYFILTLLTIANIVFAQINCATVYVTANSNSTAINGAIKWGTTDTICLLQSDTLTAHGGTSYLWSNGASTATITVSPIQSTTYTVTVTNGNSCIVNQTVTVMSLPTISIFPSGDTIFSCDQTLILKASGGNIYLWNTGAIIDSILISPSATPATYSVNGGIEYGGCIGQATRTIISIPINIGNASQNFNIGDSALFYVSPSYTGIFYQWQTDVGFGWQNISSAGQYRGTTNDSLVVNNLTTANNNQLFRCIVSAGSCSDTSNSAKLTIRNVTGILGFSKIESVSIFPNPARNWIEIVKNENKPCSFELIDLTGREILRLQLLDNQYILPIDKLASGMYVVKVTNAKGESTLSKLIKE